MGKQKYFTEEERKEASRQRTRRYREKPETRIKEKIYRDAHKKEYAICSREWYERNIEKRKIYTREYYQIHKKDKRDWENNKLKTDSNFKLAFYLRTRVRVALYNNQKSGSAVRDLGCSIPELKTYLESKFQEGMNWNNWGIHGWHIDHIIPLSSFNLSNREEFLKACHYSNLQPLWAEDNLRKKDKIITHS